MSVLTPSPFRVCEPIPQASRNGQVLYEAHEEWCAEAMETARLRRQGHAVAGSKRHWGKPEDCSDEYFGSLGSLVFHRHCRARGIDMELAPLYVPNARLADLPPWDARVGDMTIEIKTIPPDTQREDGSWVRRSRLLVKQSENHYSQFYAAVRFESVNRYWFAGYASLDEVLAAPTFGNHAPAHALPLAKLHRMASAPWLKVAGR